jgi:hypothetical protein
VLVANVLSSLTSHFEPEPQPFWESSEVHDWRFQVDLDFVDVPRQRERDDNLEHILVQNDFVCSLVSRGSIGSSSATFVRWI